MAEGIRTRLTSTRSIVTIKEASSGAGEPWGRRLWLSLAAVLLVAIALDSYGIASWPMADDEVPTLVELGLQRVEAAAFSVPSVQLERLPRALPIYYAFQGFALRIHDVEITGQTFLIAFACEGNGVARGNQAAVDRFSL